MKFFFFFRFGRKFDIFEKKKLIQKIVNRKNNMKIALMFLKMEKHQ